IVQVVVGYLTGRYIREQGQVGWLWPRLQASAEPRYKMLAGLFVVAALLSLLGLFWGLEFPINKKIWTSSYVLYTSGLALFTIGVMIWFIEVLGKRNWLTRFFDVF